MDAPHEIYNSLNSIQDIRSLIGKEENLFLEVKRASANNKKYLAIAISGFANSAGGVLIFGLVTSREKPDEPDVIRKEDPVKHLDRVVSDFQSLIGKVVVPIVEGVQVKPISYAPDVSRGFVLILVPASEGGPHRTILKESYYQYYKRSGDSFYIMEHFDLADMFGRRRKPDLRFCWRPGHISISNKAPSKFALVLSIENVGRAIARFPLFQIREMVGATIFEYGVTGNRQHGLPMLRSDRQSDVTFAGGVNQVIHPGTTLEVTALGLLEVAKVQDVKFKLLLAAEDFEVQTQEVIISREEVLRKLHVL